MPIKANWQERYEAIDPEESFDVHIDTIRWLREQLTPEENARLVPKLKLIEDHARELAYAMLKGTLKYDSDPMDPAYFDNHSRDEWIDGINYQLLKEWAIRESTGETN